MAITSTVTAAKIDITSTGGVEVTMSEIVTHLADAAVMEEVGTTITIKKSAGLTYAREFEISNLCKIVLEEGYTLEWESITTSSTYYYFEIAIGAEFRIERDCTMNFDADSTVYNRVYTLIYGKLTIEGEVGHEVTWRGFRANLFYNRTGGDVAVTYCNFEDCTYVQGYYLYITSNAYTGTYPTISFTHCRMTDTTTYLGYGIRVNPGQFPMTNFTFNYIHMEHIYTPVYSDGAKGLKFTNSTFKDTTNQLQIYGASGTGGVLPIKSPNIREEATQNTLQPAIRFEDCIFDDCDSGVYGTYNYYGNHIVFKDCTFMNMIYGHYSSYDSIASLLGTQTYTNMTAKWTNAYGGGTLLSHEIGITIQDSDGNPIEGVAFTSTEVNGYEIWTGISDSNGAILSVTGDKIILAKTAYYAYAENTPVDWSGKKFLSVKDGYNKDVQNYTVTQDEDIIITLITENEQATTIYDSTIYDSVIY